MCLVRTLKSGPIPEAVVAAGQAEAMDRMYRVQRHIYDLTRRFYLLGRDRLLRGLPVQPGASVLDLGCGTGRNLIRLSRLRPDLRLCGVDASAAMLETARVKIGRAGIGRAEGGTAQACRLACCLAEDLDPARDLDRDLGQGFDAVYFSYVLSIIPEPAAAMDAAWALVRPGGVLAVVDFGDFARLPAWFGRMLRAWLALFGVRPKPEVGARLQAMAEAEGAELVREDHCRGYAVLYWLRKAG